MAWKVHIQKSFRAFVAISAVLTVIVLLYLTIHNPKAADRKRWATTAIEAQQKAATHQVWTRPVTQKNQPRSPALSDNQPMTENRAMTPRAEKNQALTPTFLKKNQIMTPAHTKMEAVRPRHTQNGVLTLTMMERLTAAPAPQPATERHPAKLDGLLDQSHAAPLMKVEIFPAWTTSDPHDETLIRRVYIYSAIVALHEVASSGTDIHFSVFQDGRLPVYLTCCLKLSNSDEVHTGQLATRNYARRRFITGVTYDERTMGVVYRCSFPFTNQQLRDSHVTLTSSSCPGDVKQYLSVHHPVVKPGGLAVCAKLAYGLRLDPNKLIEWFEAQRLLGVDKIQLFDLNNTDIVYKIFRHYQDMGLLELLPYKLPGRPWGRFVLKDGKDWTRYGDDKELVIWDCRLRLAGYDYIMGVDLDEVIMPRHFTALKPFLKYAFAKYQKASSLHFKVQFFLDNWGPVDPKAPLLFLRYLNSTYPEQKVSKYVYLPRRSFQAATHDVRPFQGYRRVFFVPTSEATVFHYRTCKQNWKFSCEGPRMTDKSMQRFQDNLIPAVSSLRQKLGLRLP